MGFGGDGVTQGLAAATELYDEAGRATHETSIQTGRGETRGARV